MGAGGRNREYLGPGVLPKPGLYPFIPRDSAYGLGICIFSQTSQMILILMEVTVCEPHLENTPPARPPGNQTGEGVEPRPLGRPRPSYRLA